ncbi:LCP family protein [Ligilactobacillus sp. WILCCON 0076]|uniref:LCP family protein n=1 Tax=Ligilactobacillus ubinensis TaxID=2876789 RepID=A0A9X2FNC3_9LACO|nr:LCP family protein [Ligilactobacillus ubinensis]MCP0887511.1 LCP family protein [Ligilactobacillus ubinensis]
MNKKNRRQHSDYVDIPPRREQNNTAQRSRHAIKHKPNVRRKRVFLALLVITLGIFYGGGAYLYNMLYTAKTAVTKTYTKSNVKKLRNVSQVLKSKKAISILLLGTDTGDLGRTDKGRTDTIIIATINPSTKRVTLTSIPRDLQVKVSGSSDSYDKINAAYTIGGVSSSIKTIQNTLHIPIDFYVLVNMGGLKKIVNAIGGVTITPTLTFSYDSVSVTKGKKVTLNGSKALAYSRMRYSDPLGDYGRQKRQRQIITAIIKKSMSVSTLSSYKKLLATLEDNMKTDLTYNDILTIISEYKDAGKTIKSYTLQGEDATINGVSYQVGTAETKKKTSTRIRKELGLNASTATFIGRIYSSYSSYGTTSSYGSTSSSSYYGNYSTRSSYSTYGGRYSTSSSSRY